MIIRKLHDHVVVQSPLCGEIREILRSGDYPAASLAVAVDIRPTEAHYHSGFDEIYFVLDGSITLRFYDPSEDRSWTESLCANELCLINKGVHHKIIESSETNRLCAICVPAFDHEDEYASDQLCL